ncbi:MAG: VCBS repeat-containing protein [Planctomycetes bacterium]|nr:VCBS repeat-containing protein [Planctomycetota bacterium]
MNRLACPLLLLLAAPLAAQSPFRLTRLTTLPPIPIGDKYAAGDVDGDGDQDLVVANDNAPHQLLLNDGRGRFVDATSPRLINPLQLATHSVDLVDVDGDGDLDILFGHDDWLSNQVYINNGAGFFTDMTPVMLPPNAEFTQNQVVGDFDGDGDVDWFTVDSPGCHLYANNGVGVFTDVSATHLSNLPTGLGSRFEVTPRAADIDGDGDLDICVPTGTSTNPVFLENIGGGHFAPATVSMPAVTGLNYMFVDIDGDGDADLVSSYPGRVLQNNGSWTFADVTATAFPSSPGNFLSVIDADGDGDADLYDGNGIWWNNGSGVFTLQVGATHYLGNRGAAVADFDGDGDLDFAGLPNFLRQVDAGIPPVRGNSYTVDFHTRPGTVTPVLSLVALGAGNVAMPGVGTLLLDPASTVTIGMHLVVNTPLTVSLQIPTAPAFAGLELHHQAVMIDLIAGLRFSNAIGEPIL